MSYASEVLHRLTSNTPHLISLSSRSFSGLSKMASRGRTRSSTTRSTRN